MKSWSHVGVFPGSLPDTQVRLAGDSNLPGCVMLCVDDRKTTLRVMLRPRLRLATAGMGCGKPGNPDGFCSRTLAPSAGQHVNCLRVSAQDKINNLFHIKFCLLKINMQK